MYKEYTWETNRLRLNQDAESKEGNVEGEPEICYHFLDKYNFEFSIIYLDKKKKHSH